MEIIKDYDEPPSTDKVVKVPPSGRVESVDRDCGKSDNLFQRNIFGRGQILNRSLSLLNLYSALVDK